MVAATSTILLKGGILLIHDEHDHVIPTVADLLVSDGKISKIEKSIEAPAHASVIDCVDKIISPGFIDTHRHMWQTQLKGTQANNTLVEYMPWGMWNNHAMLCLSREIQRIATYTKTLADETKGLATPSLYTPDDMFWGQLSGCMESLDAGTTTVVDHSHATLSPELAYKAIQATASSGIRSVFCYTPTFKVKSWSPLELSMDHMSEPWVMETYEKLAAKGSFGDGRVLVGYGFDGANFLPAEVVKETFKRLRELETKLITIHASGGPLFGRTPKTVATLSEYSVLGPDVLLSHANDLLKEDAAVLHKTGARLSTTPSTELQMGLSTAMALVPEMYDCASLGVDCHAAAHSSIPGQMSLLIQHERARRHAKLGSQTTSGGVAKDLSQATWSPKVGYQTEQVYNLGTVLGAKSCCMENEIGRIKVGYKADLAIFSATSPSMLGIAQEDPVSAIVLHSSPSDIETVMVDGIIRKQQWMLNPVQVSPITDVNPSAETEGATDASKILEWASVARALLESQKRIVGFMKTLDLVSAQKNFMQSLGINVNGLVA